jgi:hypothetical protein
MKWIGNVGYHTAGSSCFRYYILGLKELKGYDELDMENGSEKLEMYYRYDARKANST